MSPIKLRNRQTLTRSRTSDTNNYDEVVKTPIRKTRLSTRLQQLNNTASLSSALSKLPSSVLDKDEDDNHSRKSSEGGDSNLENKQKIIKKNLENTPQRKPTSRLSRNRTPTRRTSTYSVKKTSNDDNEIKLSFTRQIDEILETPKTSERPRRESAVRCRIITPLYMDSLFDDTLSSDEEEDSNSKRSTRKRNATYFNEADFAEYRPDPKEMDDEEDEVEADEEEDSEEGEEEAESSEDGAGVSEDEEEVAVTPNKPSFREDWTKLASTPELLNRIQGRTIKRRIGLNSPVATGSQTMSPNPETYFLAETRIKYKAIAKKSEAVMNDAMKGKRKRKKLKVSDLESRLPEKIPSDFSVTAEAMKANVSPDEYTPGNIHEERVDELYQSIVENDFPHWLRLFRDDFNIILYGYGSKLSILRKFEGMINNHFLTVTINGLFPKHNPRKLLQGICEYVNPDEPVPHGTNLEAVAKEAVKLLKAVSHSDVFIVINNFDNLALRFPQILTILCWLVQVPYIHILASSDSVNAFLGVTQSQTLQLNFCWMHCPTYIPYREELKWIPGIYGDETKVVTQKSSLKYVLQSLTGNARKAFAILAQMQLKQMKSRAVQKAKEAYAGVRFQELAKECREKFIAHSDENLRTLLVEFFDHKLIRQTGKGKHLENTLLIELDVDTLEEIISELG